MPDTVRMPVETSNRQGQTQGTRTALYNEKNNDDKMPTWHMRCHGRILCPPAHGQLWSRICPVRRVPRPVENRPGKVCPSLTTKGMRYHKQLTHASEGCCSSDSIMIPDNVPFNMKGFNMAHPRAWPDLWFTA